MKKFLTTILLFALPLVLWSFIVIAIDPFSYFNISNIIKREIKDKTALGLNDLLYKAIACYHHPSEYILSGDSRVGDLPINEIENISGIKYILLNSDGAKLNEIFDLIYFANGQKKLKHIVVGINFNLFNEFGYADRVTNVKEILKNPLLYIFNKNVAQACYYTLRAAIIGANVTSVPPMSKEEFWKWNLDVRAVYWYGKYKFPQQLYNDLLKLDSFTKANNIKLTFIIVPQQIEFHDRLVHYGLSANEMIFKEIMSKLNATVIDYDYENSIAMDKNNYSDPVHYNREVGKLIVHEVWSDSLIIGRKL
jgi:hypothetical protein